MKACLQLQPEFCSRENLPTTSWCSYLSWVKIALRSFVNDINFMDPVRKVHEEPMNQVRGEAICINNKYTIQTESLHFEWDKVKPTLKKEFPDILKKMLNHNSQMQPLNPNENRSISHRNRHPYNNFRRRINNRTRTLTTPIPPMTHLNMASRSHHFSYSMPEKHNTCHGNCHFTNHTYQATQTRGHVHHCIIQKDKHII